jgi:glutamate dehydrogenase
MPNTGNIEQTLERRFYQFVAAEDLGQHDPQRLHDDVVDMLGWASIRPAGHTIIRVFHSPDEGRTVLEIVTDDMPFLVDSVTNELTRQGRDISLIVHPLLAVHRNPNGELVQIVDVDIDEATSAIPESWMRIEFDRDYADDECSAIESGVRKVLSDVRKAVSDWGAMRQRALRLADELTSAPPSGIALSEVQETAALLRWLTDENLTFLGYREYDLVTIDGEDALRPIVGSGLGILRFDSDDDAVSLSFATLPPAVRNLAREPRLLILSKANSRSTVHRSTYLDYIGIKRFDDRGNVIGEHRFLGVYTASAYNDGVREIPVLREKYQAARRNLDFVASSHSAKDLLQFMETYPRDELFQIDVARLTNFARSVLQLQERRQTRLFLRPDDFGRYMSALVYLPRDRYTTAVRMKIENILTETFGGISAEFTARVTESVLARLHYVIHVPAGEGLPSIDETGLEDRISAATRSWADEYHRALREVVPAATARDLMATYSDAFPEAYKEDFSPEQAVVDSRVIENLQPGEIAMDLSAPVVSDLGELRFRITRIGEPMSLSKVLPILQRLGADVRDEYPYEISRRDAQAAWILDFGVVLPSENTQYNSTLFTRFQEAFLASWNAQVGIDTFNTLVVTAGLTWRECVIIRAYARYYRQIGATFGQGYIEESVLAHPAIARDLVELFIARFDPALEADRDATSQAIIDRIDSRLADVESLDQDRILREFLIMITATVRTSYFIPGPSDQPRPDVSFKIEPRNIPDIPLPAPLHEIWVYSPRVEGVHLRFGDVARGGLRWSDRREDFRTEILGLVKAQEVKNAVIVPVGAKGGFYPKRLPDPSIDRDAWYTEGVAAYTEFISAMLDITDNLVDGLVSPPHNVVRHDGDDPYLVVAADKGTASFSDIANSIAAQYKFWLGDAFASGGSVGYDHKAMGITARGAWESVQRHFRELDVNTQTDDFTVIGIGDMSGDVFGNGMLLSEHIRLIAAFDHRHIFIDPNPDAHVSFAERQRLFDLPRSSWADYQVKYISQGGGVFPRSAKSIPLTEEITTALDINPDVVSLTPDQLISAILAAPANLLWNGGIGTYVKAQNEAQSDVGDKANDAIRINGHQLRVQVIGEGGNLGLTQRGRIEAARHGVKLNTDAIDNSAGVDTSDHEVNIKILLDSVVKAGDLSFDERNTLLAQMTNDISSMVLRDNYDQNVVLGNARRGAPALISVHQRMIKEMEKRGILDRSLESLPDDEEFHTLISAGSHLTSPELAVLLAYAKIWLTSNLNKSNLSDDPWFRATLQEYFPDLIQRRFPDAIDAHPLRGRIIDTVITNSLLNVGGITFVYRAIEETGASVVQVVRAATAAMEVFNIREIWGWVNALDNKISTRAQSALQLETRRLLDRATRWFLLFRGGELDIGAEVESFRTTVADHAHHVPEMLRGNEAERYRRRVDRFIEAGAPEALAHEAAAALDVFALLDITDICRATNESADSVIALYFALSDRYDVDRTLMNITDLPRSDRWSALARQALRTDLYQVIAALTTRVIEASSAKDPALHRIEQWEMQHAESVSRARTTLAEISAVDNPDLATLSVCLRVLRNLAAQG